MANGNRMKYGSLLDDNPFEIASRLGLDVVIPTEHELFVDIDDESDLLVLDSQIETLNRNLAGQWVDPGAKPAAIRTRTTRSRGGNCHAVVLMPFAVTPLERVLLQAALGSDRRRELLSYLRIKFATDRPPTLFFEVPSERRDQP
ncbi:MAG: hypothetical protein KC583_19235 [Myxococcales bacterium]|nr:hypothetical protein [Myxococcales bacterium]